MQGKGLASPGPAGLMVLSFYLGSLFPVFTGLAPPSAVVLTVPLGFAGAIVQLTCGIVALRRDDILAGNMMLAFSAFMWLGCISNLMKILEWMPSSGLEIADGFIFLIMGIFMLGFTAPFMKIGIAQGMFMLTTDIFFLSCAAAWLLNIPVLIVVAGWSALGVVIAIIWSVLAEVHNTLENRVVISVGKPMIRQKNKPPMDEM